MSETTFIEPNIMSNANRIRLALLLLRLGIFVVMAVWTLDKFVRPEHTAKVFEFYYGLSGVSSQIAFVLALAEGALLLAFVVGLKPRVTYGTVLLLHGVSTISSYKQYLQPFESNNLLFFAAWPMLAACFALYILRDFDTWRVPGCTKGCKPKAVH